MPNISRSNIHLDILMGRDETLDVSDFFGSESLFRALYIPTILGFDVPTPQSHSRLPRLFDLQPQSTIPLRTWMTVHTWNVNTGYRHDELWCNLLFSYCKHSAPLNVRSTSGLTFIIKK
jgi:hypothetical protein